MRESVERSQAAFPKPCGRNPNSLPRYSREPYHVLMLRTAQLALLCATTVALSSHLVPRTRRDALFQLLCSGSAGAAVGTARLDVAAAAAAEAKQLNLAPADLANIVAADISERQFLVSGRLTRSIYDESCTFTDVRL